GSAAQTVAWEAQKAEERRAKAAAAGRPESALDGVGLGLPALTRAEKLQKRAARVGFDWSDAAGVRAKVDEELHEVDAVLAGATGDAAAAARLRALEGELGDLLFTIVNLSRHLQVDAESALRGANDKFERRFARMEALARTRGLEPAQLSAAQWEELWSEAKLNAS
ncbi:MAG: nucleoside triphosphate pyrophosphohydrolase, partial [Gammaproteobacteria bacterium]|nr:nucleoside triphosphate pyrophosphohydrolase [Gammaproteobacteria bacterium]